MTEAENTDTTETPARDLEAALYHLAGAAGVASFMLTAIYEDESAAAPLSIKEGMAWLARQLGDGAENLVAIHESREPHWATMMEAEGVRQALERASARGVARAAARVPFMAEAAE